MKVYEVLDDIDVIKTDLKHNRGRAVVALVKGAKRKSNATPTDTTPERQQDTRTEMG